MGHVTADTLISDVLSEYPGSVEVFDRHGLGCASCIAASMEALSVVTAAHDVDLDLLLAELNSLDTSDCVPNEEEL